jgi:Kef-type K+ transport system membrane component KefB
MFEREQRDATRVNPGRSAELAPRPFRPIRRLGPLIDAILLRELGTLLLGATALVLLARLVRIPSIVAYIVAGLLVGPALHLVTLSPATDLIAEAGIILLLFLVGLEISFQKMRAVGRLAIAAGVAQIVVTAGALAGLALALGLRGGDALFVATALTFSSTVVAVKLLDQLKALDRRYGQIAVGILLVQDLAVIVVLTFVAGTEAAVTAPAAAAGVQTSPDAGLFSGLLRAFGGMIVLFGAAALLAWRILPRLFGAVARSQPALLAWSLSWCFLLVLGSELLELSLELGAFVAGVSLAQLPYSRELRRRVHPLMNFFVAVFFVSLGVHMDLRAALGLWPLVAAMAVFSLLVKPPLVAWIVRGLGEAPRTALRVGLTLAQTSEFSFILAALALSHGLVGEPLVAAVGAVGLVTMGVSSLAIAEEKRIVDGVAERGLLPLLTGARKGHAGADAEDREPERPRGHVIVVGMNTLGRRLVELLIERGERVLAIDTDLAKLRRLPRATFTFIGNADYFSVLEEAGIRDAKLVVSALQIEEVNRLLAYRCSRLGVPTVIHAQDLAAEMDMEGLGVTHFMNSRESGVLRMVEELRQVGIFPA